MRVVIQKVTTAKIEVEGQIISSIGRGLCVLIGISKTDSTRDVDFMARKILSLRLFEDTTTGKRWMKSVKDENLEVMCISQFTLYHTLKGNKPDFHNAMQGPDAQNLYNAVVAKLITEYGEDKVKDGKFGAHMQVFIQNDGPVTIEIESYPNKFLEQNNRVVPKKEGPETSEESAPPIE